MYMNLKHFIVKVVIFLAKFIPNGMRFIILRGPLRGSLWIAGGAAGEAKGLSVILNLWESEQIEIAKELSSKNKICFDIGAYVGLYTLLFARYSKIVYAFEPFTRNISFLYKTLVLNSIENAVIIPSAVADINGIYMFKEGIYTATGKLDKKGKHPILCVSLDYFIEKTKIFPDIIKIDVEGAEVLVFKGAKKIFLKHKPIILLSTHGEKIKTDCLNFLKKMNYQDFIPLNGSSIENANEFLIKP